MGDFKFNCPHCSNLWKHRKKCWPAVRVSFVQGRNHTPPILNPHNCIATLPPPQKQTKACPYCAEEILFSSGQVQALRRISW